MEGQENAAGETDKQGQQQTNTPAGLTEDSVKTMIAEAVKATEKTWQSRFDQKNTELQRLKTEKMTAEERAAFDLAEKTKELEAQQKAFRAEKAKADRITATATVGLPSSFAAFIAGDSTEDISKSAADLKKAVDALVAEKVRVTVYSGGTVPEAGDSVDLSNLSDQAYMAARAKQLESRGRFN